MPTRSWTLIAVLAFAVSIAACKKDDLGTESSGELGAAERALFAHLPADAFIVFGGSYERFMSYWKSSPFKNMTTQFSKMAGAGNTISDFMDCLVTKGMKSKLAGTMSYDGGSLTANMLFDGLAGTMLKDCAKRSNFPVHQDDDGKYFEIRGVPDGMGATSDVGYYFVAEKTLLFSMKVPLGFGARPKNAKRADFEKLVAKAKANSAADDKAMQALIAKADRSKAFWFAGNANGTPAAQAVVEGTAWLDTSATSLSFGFSVVLADPSVAKEAVDQFKKVPDMFGMLPPDVKGVAKDFYKSSKLSHSGATLKGRFVIKNELLEKLVPLMGQMGGGF